MSSSVAVVTGSNKGIGFAIVRGLCKQFNGAVYLTARDEGRGKAAVEELKKEGLNPNFHQLDICDRESIKKLRNYLKEKYGGLDILVNNAGIAYKNDSTAPFGEQAEVTVRTNYTAMIDVCEDLFSILRPHARVSTVSSMVSQMALAKCSPEVKAKILGTKTVEELSAVMAEFVQFAKEGKHSEKGWPNSAYGSSKIGVTQLSVIQQAEMDKDPREDILINCCCPGYVDTDMSSHKGHLTIDEGAVTPLYVALLPANSDGPRGKFLREKKVSPWE